VHAVLTAVFAVQVTVESPPVQKINDLARRKRLSVGANFNEIVFVAAAMASGQAF